MEIEVVSCPTPMPSWPPIAANSRASASAVSAVVPSRIMLPVRSASQTWSFCSCRFAAWTTSRIVTFGTWPNGTIVTGSPFASVNRFGLGMHEVLGRAGRRRLLLLLGAWRRRRAATRRGMMLECEVARRPSSRRLPSRPLPPRPFSLA